MITLGTWSDDSFTGAPADPNDTLTFLERASRTAQLYGREVNDEWQGPMRPGISALYDAAERQARLVDGSSARRAAREDVYDRMIGEVRRVTGEDLANPLMRNTSELAGRIARGEFNGWADPRLDELIAGREDAFLARIQELKAKLGDRLAVDPFTPVGAQARANAAQAEADFKREWAREDLPLLGQLGAMFAGSMIGSREDPLFWISLGFGGPAKNATTPVARIATSALSNAVANAGFSAVAQPTVQAWRAEIGVESGLGEALQNIGMAGAIGAVAGGGMTAIGEVVARIGRGRGSADRAVKEIEAAGGFVDDDTRAALKAAELAGEADDATFRLPDGVNPAEGVQSLADAARAAVEVDAPLPMGSRPVRPGVTDALARDILDNAGDPMAGLQRLRESPDAIESAIASELPDVRAAGYAATLGDAAFARVMAGEVDPVAASVVARMTASPPHQAALLERIMSAGARTEDDIRMAASDAVRAMAAREAAAAQMGIAPEMLLTPAELAARRDALTRVWGGDLMTRVSQIEGDIAGARTRLDELLQQRANLVPAMSEIDAARLSQLQAELASITGKRKTGTRANELRAAIAEIQGARAEMAAGAEGRIDSDVVLLRQRIVELQNERAALGPEVNRLNARIDAELAPIVSRELPFVFGDPDWVKHPVWREAARVQKRDGLTSRDVALERAVIEESAADPIVKRIIDDVSGDVQADRQAAPGDRGPNSGGPDARPGEGGAAGADARAGGGSDAGAPAVMRRADPSVQRNLVPIVDDAGNVAMVDRFSAELAGERPRLLADIVTACRI
jgi:hypothetical protein